jgi:hypothetical protein
MAWAERIGGRPRPAGGRRRAAVAGALVVGLGLAGCGSGGSHSATSASTGPGPSSHTSTASHHTKPKHHHQHHQPRPPKPKLPPIGTTQSLNAYGSHLHVTATKVLDPLPYRAANVLAGTRPVGVEVRIAVISGATYDSTASGDWSLEVSPAGAGAAPLSVNSGVCETPLQDFESAVYGGDVRPGCVAFSVPKHAKITAVVFAPHSNTAKAVRWR